MNRRQILTGTAAATGLIALAPVGVAQQRFVEGQHYQRLPQKVPTGSGDKIEVVEVFWYGCPHCFRFEPQIEAWLERKPDNVDFVQVPGVGGRWTLAAVVYYTAKQLGVVEQSHKAMFDHIHVHRNKLDSLEAAAEFYTAYGVDPERFQKVADSFGVKTNVKRAAELMKRYQVTGVPSLIVNGEFKTNSLPVVNYLIAQQSA